MTLGAVFYKMNTVQLGDLNGIGRRMPLTMGAFVIGGLSLVGVPLTVGFISKWYLVVAALEQQWWWLVVILIVGSLLALIYIWRVVEVAYLKPAPAGCATRNEAPLTLLIPTWILIAGNIYFGIHTSLTVDVAESASTMLFGK